MIERRSCRSDACEEIISADLEVTNGHVIFNNMCVFQQGTAENIKKLGNTIGGPNILVIRNTILRWAKSQGYSTAQLIGFRIEGSAANPGVVQGQNKVYDLNDY